MQVILPVVANFVIKYFKADLQYSGILTKMRHSFNDATHVSQSLAINKMIYIYIYDQNSCLSSVCHYFGSCLVI